MQVNLTFNKPAALQFFEQAGVNGVKVRIEGKGKVLFKASAKESGRDVFPLTPRTRGGVGITITGGFAEQFLKTTGMGRGTHMELAGTSHKWVAADAVEGKPSKVVPTARLWREIDETGSKAEAAPARKTRTPRASATAGATRKPRAQRAAAAN